MNERWESGKLSFWLLKYERLPSEGKELFKTNNGLNGFMQRMNDKLRPVSLGVFGVYGDSPALEMIGCALFVGNDLPVPMDKS